jgi:hypothetical protein
LNKRIFKGDLVRVVASVYRDVEDHEYVKSFAGKEGQLFDVTISSEGVESYHINFGNEIGIFYKNEIELVTT